MQRLQQLVVAFSLLPFATQASCVPRLQVSQMPAGGSRAASILPPPGCHCQTLMLSVCARKVHGIWQVCENPNTQHWLYLTNSVNHSLVLEGYYQPAVKDCWCETDSNCTHVEERRGVVRFVSGLRLNDWNLTISPVLLRGGRLSVQVVRQFGAHADAGRVFFRQLNIALLHASNVLKFVASSSVNCSGDDGQRPTEEDGRCPPVVFGGGSAYLLPGTYKVRVAPAGDAQSQITRHWMRWQPVEVVAPVDSAPSSPVQPAGSSRFLLMPLLSCLSTVLIVLLVWVTWQIWRHRMHIDRTLPTQRTVLLLPAQDRAPELDTIKTYLLKHGARTRDFQEKDVFRAFQSQPCVPAVLGLPALRDARIVFVCAERDAPPLRSPAAELWQSVLRFVRNWRPTELVVLTTQRGLDLETTGLAAARAFHVPEELDKFVRYLRDMHASDAILPGSTPRYPL